MSMSAEAHHPLTEDPVSNVLKWTLLAVAVLTFALLGWATAVTYRTAPPQPERLVTPAGAVLMTGNDVVAGKAGFQKADLMDYGSLYGMGSYYGEDYTASTLVRLATATRDNVARTQYGKPFSALTAEQQAAAASTMRAELQGVDLTRPQVVIPDALASAINTVRRETATALNHVNAAEGWTPAYSLNADRSSGSAWRGSAPRCFSPPPSPAGARPAAKAFWSTCCFG